MTDLSPVRFLDRVSPPHILTLTVMSAASAIPMNIFVASLPAMAVAFNVSYAVMALSISLYLATAGVVQVIVGPLSDRFGRRPVTLWALGIFLLATLGATFAPDYYSFMVFRIIQAAAITLTVIARATIRDMVTREKAASMIGYVTMGMSVAPMLAPAIGGYIEGAFGWRANFIALFGTGILTFVLIYFDQGETNLYKSSSFAQQFKTYPNLLKSKRFWGYVFSGALGIGMFFSYLSSAPIIGERVYGLSPQQVGLYLAITPLGYFVGNGISGRHAVTWGIPRMLLLGSILGLLGMVAGLISIQLAPNSPLAFFAFTASIGLCNGMILPSANAGLLDVRPELAGSAAGLGGALMTLTGAFLGAMATLYVDTAHSAAPMILFVLGIMVLALIVILWTIGQEKKQLVGFS
ncbi:Bcr/CflA family drug resistance efflux transporter [Amylibacter marinus]|uniref:Bcr/CflA family efflux transporter n=1 Tax=Amylibacter marinus TaxID=1475483 RepID=A0ABQ5VTM9_9RHOB|nr:multidrug effflux MFS transporter [Amylibacter marinus]GLQ34631.1 Bcr/CflA family drug resistance efflux transporter [Amylibacter marinus]